MISKKQFAPMLKIIDFQKKCGNTMLSGSGTRIQFELCIFLASLIPVFALAYLSIYTVSVMDKFIVFLLVLPVVLSGYIILKRYPRAIMTLRHDLEKISTGELPDKININTTDTDIHSIKESLDQILHNTRITIAKIKKQQAAIIDMERSKVMHESIGTTCHHMGQPLSVLSADLHLMRDHQADVDMAELIQECCISIDQLSTILIKLNSITEYQPTPYMPQEENTDEEVNILTL